jgi:hypothetical protein
MSHTFSLVLPLFNHLLSELAFRSLFLVLVHAIGGEHSSGGGEDHPAEHFDHTFKSNWSSTIKRHAPSALAASTCLSTPDAFLLEAAAGQHMQYAAPWQPTPQQPEATDMKALPLQAAVHWHHTVTNGSSQSALRTKATT